MACAAGDDAPSMGPLSADTGPRDGPIGRPAVALVDRDSAVPLYRQLYEHYRERIVRGELAEGARLPSLRQLERRTGLARESIKRAMAELATEGFVNRIQGKGTFVSLQKAERRFWGVVVPFYAEYYNKLLLELGRAAERQGATLEHACDYDDWQRQVELTGDFAWRRAEAIIVVPTRDEPKTLRHFLRLSRHMTVVLFDHTSIASQLPYVIQDYVYGVRLALQALVESGARRIDYVRDPLWAGENPIFQTMEQAFLQATEAQAGEPGRIWGSPEALSEAGLEHREFDALFCVNDQVACLATGRLREAGIAVPGQVQVMGYNDSDVGRFFTPQIATINPDLTRMCGLVERIILRQKAGKAVEEQQYVSIPRLVPRASIRGRRLPAEGQDLRPAAWDPPWPEPARSS